MMGELAASLAHELKQPISAAIMNADACLELLEREQPDIPELRDATSAMVRSAKRGPTSLIVCARSPQRALLRVGRCGQIIREIAALLKNQLKQYSVLC